MSELQTADAIEGTLEVAETEEQQTGTVESGSELAPDSGESREEKDPAIVAQEIAQKAINKQHAKYREEERKRKEAESRIQAMEQKLQKFETSKPEPTVPPIPDPYEDDYEEKVKARDIAIKERARFERDQEFKTEQETKLAEEKQTLEQKKAQEQSQRFEKRTAEIGLDAETVSKAVKAVVDYGVNQDIAQFLLSDDDGPAMVAYLAGNPIELSELNEMSPMQAAIKLNSEVREKAGSVRPKQSNAPDPAITLSGNGVPEASDPWVAGGKFS